MGFFSAVRRLATDVSDPRDDSGCLKIISAFYDYLDTFNVDPDRPLYFYRPKEYEMAGWEALCGTFYFAYERDPTGVSFLEKRLILHITTEGDGELYLQDLLDALDDAYQQYGNTNFIIAFDSPIEGETFYSEKYRFEFDEDENAIVLFGKFRTQDVIDLFKPKTGAFAWF